MFDDFQFELRYPTMDLIVEQILWMGPDAMLYKVDLQCAYCNLRTDPCDHQFLGLRWNNQCYVDVSILFGLKSGASVC